MNPRFVYAYLNQGEFWHPNGRPRLPIAEMDERWRGNSVRWLEKRAASFLLAYQLGEIEALTTPAWRDVVGEQDGKPVLAGPALSELDLMGEHAMDAFESESDRANADPVGWIRSTALYRALVAGGETP